MTVGPADLAAWLAGRWHVARTINGDFGAFDGVASFGEDGTGGVRWEEHGRLRLGSDEVDAYRTLHVAPYGEAWEVFFDDGRPFHALDLRTGRWGAEHLCGPDVYRGSFVIDGPDALRVRWRVTGPGRDDRLDGRYRRC